MTVDTPSIRQITSSDPETVDRLAAVMAEAFNTRDDPMYDALYGGGTVPDVDDFNLVRCKGRVYDALVNKMVFAVEEDGKIAAFATVFPPGVHSTKPTQNPYSAELEARTPSAILPTQNLFHDTIDSFERDAFGTNHYYMLEHVVELARKEGKITTLTTATDSNVPYYKKQGFKLVAESVVKLRGIDVPLWAFTKH